MKILWIPAAVVGVLFLISVVVSLLGVNDWKLKNYLESEMEKTDDAPGEASEDKT